MILHKLMRKIHLIYEKNEAAEYLKRIGRPGENVTIGYPSVLGNPENIVIGDNTEFQACSRLQTFPQFDELSKLEIGNNCWFGYRTSILASAPIKIGNNVLFGSDITVVSHNHGVELSEKSFMEQDLNMLPVSIGNNVWIGDKCVILPGITIGDNVVIGAGSVVTKDIPCNCVAVGSPAKIIKKI